MTKQQFVEMCEQKLKECDNINNAPFGMNGTESTCYNQGRAVVLQWVLEMMPDVK